jgi:hypothetical protein
MDEAIKILRHAEDVLMKKIKGLKDGKPKWLASEKLRELRNAITVLKQANLDEEFAQMDEKEEDEILEQIFTNRPPQAQA